MNTQWKTIKISIYLERNENLLNHYVNDGDFNDANHPTKFYFKTTRYGLDEQYECNECNECKPPKSECTQCSDCNSECTQCNECNSECNECSLNAVNAGKKLEVNEKLHLFCA